VVIQRVENYLLDCVKSGGRVRRTLALLALTVGGLLALAVGALAAFAQIAGLYLVAGLMGTTNLTLPALVHVGFMYPVWRCWRWWRNRREVDAGKLD
jgi:hypothetical protein